MAAEAESLSEPSLRPGQSSTRRQTTCEDVSNKAPGNRTGREDQQLQYHTHTHAFLSLCPFCPESGAGVTHSVVLPSEGVFCAHFWDGFLCWEETPAGKSVTKTCPDQPDLDLDSAGETNHTDEKTNSRFSALTFMCKKPLICVMGVKGQGVSRVIRLYLTGSMFAQLFIRICNVLKHLTPDLQILNNQINTFMRF